MSVYKAVVRGTAQATVEVEADSYEEARSALVSGEGHGWTEWEWFPNSPTVRRFVSVSGSNDKGEWTLEHREVGRR